MIPGSRIRKHLLPVAVFAAAFGAVPVSGSDILGDSTAADREEICQDRMEADPDLLAFARLFTSHGNALTKEECDTMLALIDRNPSSVFLQAFFFNSINGSPLEEEAVRRFCGLVRDRHPDAGGLNLSAAELILVLRSREKAGAQEDPKEIWKDAAPFFRSAYECFYEKGRPFPKEDGIERNQMRAAFLKYMTCCLIRQDHGEAERILGRLFHDPDASSDPEIAAGLLPLLLQRKKELDVLPSPLGPLSPEPVRNFIRLRKITDSVLAHLAEGRYSNLKPMLETFAFLIADGKENRLRDACLTRILRDRSRNAMLIYAAMEDVAGNRMTGARILEAALGFPETEEMKNILLYPAAVSGYLDAQDPDSALRLLKQGKGSMPEESNGRLLVRAWMMKKDMKSALAAAETLKDPLDRSCQKMFIFFEMKDYEKAYKESLKAAEERKKRNIPPEKTERVFLLFHADLCEKLGKIEEVRRFLEPLILRNDRDGELLNFLGYVLADHGTDLEYAWKLISAALEIEPDNPAYLDSMAWVLYRKKNFGKAKEYILRALELSKKDGETDAVILDHAGDIFEANGDHETACGYWEKALRTADDPLPEKIRKKLEKTRKAANPDGVRP